MLQVLGTPTRIGENGQGLMLKLAINVSLAVQMLAFSEGLLLAQRDGVDPHLAAEVMTSSPIGSPMLKARVPLVLDKPEETWFDIALMHKDIRLALAAARELTVPTPSAGVVEEVLARAGEAGYEHNDIAAIFRALPHMPVSSARP
jgi:3-hydroxyisobutyrate dehydrogenase-like beta-hydroxyacid dehydrogenase